MELIDLRATSLSHAEFGQLIKENLSSLQKAGIDTTANPLVNRYIVQMIADSELIDKGLFQIKKKDETDQLKQLDRTRDVSLMAFGRQFRVFAISKKENEKQAYELLKIVWNVFKKSGKLNYEAQSNAVDNLLEDLALAKYQGAIGTLKLTDFIADIATDNQNFKALFSLRNVQTANTIVYDMKEIRKATYKNYRHFAELIVSLARVEGAPETYFVSILKIVNQIRNYFSKLLAKRKGRTKKKLPKQAAMEA